MLFSSKEFLFIFLPVMITGYYLIYLLLRKNPLSIRIRNTWLLTGSLVFYAWGEPVYVFLMIAVIVINYVMGLVIGGKRPDVAAVGGANGATDAGNAECDVKPAVTENALKATGRDARKSGSRKALFALTIAVNILILGFFKYAGFLYGMITDIAGAGALPAAWGDRVKEIALPIGISFYTFQALSYVIDVYRGKIKAEKDPLALGLYISFFPQLIAGPIVRFETISEAIRERKETPELFSKGAERFIRGIIKKVLIADRMAVVADAVFGLVIGDKLEATVMMAWLGAISYSFQIFFDFSGYCDMAVGLGQMFGFGLPDNFDHPYIAKSVTEFWRRWHITLSGWFRDYVYIPLGGSRVGKGRLVLNLFIVWLLTGIWHGANYTFIVWGMIYFVVLTAEKLIGGRGRKAVSAATAAAELGANDKASVAATSADGCKPTDNVTDKAGGDATGSGAGIRAVFGHIYTLVVVCVAWVFFRSDSIHQALLYVKGMFGLSGTALASKAVWAYLMQNIPFYVAAIILCMPVRERLEAKMTVISCGRGTKTVESETGSNGAGCAGEVPAPDRATAGYSNAGAGKVLYRMAYLAILAAGLLLAVTYIFNNSYSPFIYFNF